MRELSMYFTSLALGKTGWVSVGRDRDASLTDWLPGWPYCLRAPASESKLYLLGGSSYRKAASLCIRVKLGGGGGWKRNFLSNPCGAWIGHGKASEGVQLSNEPSVKGDLYTSWNDACSTPHPTTLALGTSSCDCHYTLQNRPTYRWFFFLFMSFPYVLQKP
jgi:hypothetical protein